MIIQSKIFLSINFSVAQDKYLNTEEFIIKVSEFFHCNLYDSLFKNLPKF